MIKNEGGAIKVEKSSFQKLGQSELSDRKAIVSARLFELTGVSTETSQNDGEQVEYNLPGDLHWDFLMKEMLWLAEDFGKERTRHRNNGKKLSRAVEMYHKTKESKEAKKIKDDALALRRITSKISRDVKKFWFKIDKVVTFKQKADVDEIRQKSMDKHLIHLIKQTERYTNMLAENLRVGGDVRADLAKIDNSVDVNDDDSRLSRTSKSNISSQSEDSVAMDIVESDHSEEEDDTDFVPEVLDEEDDETTLLEEEARGRDMSAEDEINLLTKESEMSIEELRAMYSKMDEMDEDEEEEEDEDRVEEDDVDSSNKSVSKDADDSASEEDDTDFVPEVLDEEDDETTLLEEEARGRDMSVEEEINLLTKESEMSIEELRAMYSKMDEDEDEEDDNESDDNEEVEGEADVDEAEHVDTVEESEEDDTDFVPEVLDEEDDETTLLEEEARGRDMSAEDEINLLTKESEMSIEELRAMYSKMSEMDEDEEEEEDENTNDDEISNIDRQASDMLQENKFTDESRTDHEDEDDTDFVPEILDEEDDETTLLEEEARGRDMSVEEEINLLTKESEMSIEELRAMYSKMDEDEDDDDDEVDEEDDGEDADEEADDSEADNDINEDSDDGEKRQEASNSVEDALKRLETADLAARSIHVDRPYLLASNVSLREYQHIGLNWLVSLHERRLNGILADEMGLGKTLQTIALLAYLASYRGLWGPHLIIVPTSCLVNWETEFKKFCPSFKILTYYGGAKARKVLRTGWSKLNSFHICITSYQLVVQDATAFRRKRWYYMILDEAHNIKNFKSQRWQTLLNFNTQRRLLLTGTPLQNNLMELWSLMHFLMPHIFRSRKEFSYWFNNPLTNMVEGNRSVNNDIISKLHGIMRPFLLRRLKKDVAKQLPGKFEHIVMCKLSKRQLHLYEEFMARSTTRQSLSGGSYLGMMNVLMQLRKVCNHPDLFEPRPIVSPYAMYETLYSPIRLLHSASEKSPLSYVSSSITHLWSYANDLFTCQEANRLAIRPEDLYRSQLSATVSDEGIESTDMETSHYKYYVERYNAQLTTEKQRQLSFQSQLSYDRCTHPVLSLNWRVIEFFTLSDGIIQSVISARNDPKLSKNVPSCWDDLVPPITRRIAQYSTLLENFIFILPKILSLPTQLPQMESICRQSKQFLSKKSMNLIEASPQEWANQARQAMVPFYSSNIRQQIFFPDRKLIQFDSGKLQTLATLLMTLKAGGHKCLIFTQMSKMLDVLEIFLNLHGHTYLRLDGSTGVDRRQKLMDRFNSDSKVFCFILSTRSGGLGINLVGADTVIFYDSDWNPAMDAQAQDRAHRIGQTREVHIYRLVTASTIEENILTKAKQKRQLDYLVMTEGNFSEESLFSINSIQDMLGVSQQQQAQLTQSQQSQDASAAMAAVEDDEDVAAYQQTLQEVNTQDAEFDERVEIVPGEDDDATATATAGAINSSATAAAAAVGSSTALTTTTTAASTAVTTVDTEKDEKDLEQEFDKWQASVGYTVESIKSALKPIERFAFQFRSEVDPFYSIYYIQEQQRLSTMEQEGEGSGSFEDIEWNIGQIEKQMEEDEYQAINNQELLATKVDIGKIGNYQQWYGNQRKKLFQQRKIRIIQGVGWELVIDPRSRIPYWWNEDTHEASYSVPQLIQDKEDYTNAIKYRYNAIPVTLMAIIASYLIPYPDHFAMKLVCHRWKEVISDFAFQKHVLSIEGTNSNRLQAIGYFQGFNYELHVSNPVYSSLVNGGVYTSLFDVITAAHDGDTIILGSGHYWENNITIRQKRLRIISDTGNDQSKCILELAGEFLIEEGSTVVLGNIVIRRPRKISQRRSCLNVINSRVQLYNCSIDNEGSQGCSSIILNQSTCKMLGCIVRGGLSAGIVSVSSTVVMSYCQILSNKNSGLSLHESNSVIIEDSYFISNTVAAITIQPAAQVYLLMTGCSFEKNPLAVAVMEDELSSQHIYSIHCTGEETVMETLNYLQTIPNLDSIEGLNIEKLLAMIKGRKESPASAVVSVK